MAGSRRLTAEQFQRLASYGERRTVQAGQVLYATGDSSYDLFLIESAAVDVVREASVSEREHVVYTRSAGDFMGELSILTGQKVYVTARVREQGVVVQLHARAFRAALAEQVDIADVLIEAFRLRRRIMLDSAGSALEIVGRAASAGTRALRTYAARLQLPHAPFDADSVAGQSLMAAYGLGAEDLPAAVLFDRVLVRATPQDVARAVGLTFEPSDRDVDLVVVGAGPAGLAAAVYGASEGLVTVLLDAQGPGGQAATTSRIENYLGFPGGISGDDLTRLALVQALKFGAQVYAPCHVVGLRGEPDGPVLTLQDGSEIRARAVIVATGAHYRRLSVARWEEFEGRGSIRYSATELDVAGLRVPTGHGRRWCQLGGPGRAVPGLTRVPGRRGRARGAHRHVDVQLPGRPAASPLHGDGPDQRPSPGAVRRGGPRGGGHQCRRRRASCASAGRSSASSVPNPTPTGWTG